MIILDTNRGGYKWCLNGSVYFKGFFIYENDISYHVYKEEEACEAFNTVDSFEAFVGLLKKMIGNWSVIIDKGDTTWMAVDIARSMPLYYSNNGRYVSDSAELIRRNIGIGAEDVDINNLSELYVNYFLFGEKTVYTNIKQLDLGEAVCINNNEVKRARYFYHINKIDGTDDYSLRKKIETASYRAFERLKAVIGDRPVVLSMSGGYDSRFVGCMLKNVGLTDISCYTYGKPGNFEVTQSKRNAEALGFRWVCVEMTDELQRRNLDEVGQSYFDSYKGHDFTAYMQNFTAVRKLYEEGWFKPGSVFVTGLCGDMPTGEYVESFNATKTYSIDSAVDYLYEQLFRSCVLDHENINKKKNEIKEFLSSIPCKITDYQTWQSAVDCYLTGTSHAHWFLNMNAVHSFFGYEWLLPYWDQELLKAWYAVPSEKKYKQQFYENWLMEEICNPYGLSQKKTIGGYSRNPFTRRIQYVAGGIINFILLHLGIPFKRKGDFSNFAPLELEIFKKIKTHKCINYRKAGMMRLLALYLIEKRYGVENLKKITQKVKFKD